MLSGFPRNLDQDSQLPSPKPKASPAPALTQSLAISRSPPLAQPFLAQLRSRSFTLPSSFATFPYSFNGPEDQMAPLSIQVEEAIERLGGRPAQLVTPERRRKLRSKLNHYFGPPVESYLPPIYWPSPSASVWERVGRGRERSGTLESDCSSVEIFLESPPRTDPIPQPTFFRSPRPSLPPSPWLSQPARSPHSDHFCPRAPPPSPSAESSLYMESTSSTTFASTFSPTSTSFTSPDPSSFSSYCSPTGETFEFPLGQGPYVELPRIPSFPCQGALLNPSPSPASLSHFNPPFFHDPPSTPSPHQHSMYSDIATTPHPSHRCAYARAPVRHPFHSSGRSTTPEWANWRA